MKAIVGFFAREHLLGNLLTILIFIGGLYSINNIRRDIWPQVDFDVTTDEQGNAAVRAGAYLSENVYTDVTVTSEGTTEINLNLDITSEITAKGSVDQDGETSVGVFFERDY